MRYTGQATMIERLERRILLTECWTFLTSDGASAYEGDSLRIGLQCIGIGPGQSVSVEYNLQSGSATANEDFAGTSGTVGLIGGYGTANGEIVVPTFDDNFVEGNETLTLTLVSVSQGHLGRPYPPGHSTSAPLTIIDDPPIVTIEAVDASATENAEGEEADPGQFIVHRTGGLLSQPINVFYAVEGTATEGEDYEALPASVPVTNQAPIDVNVIDDPDAEGIESIELTLIPEQEPQPAAHYILGQPVRAPALLDDNVSVRSAAVEVLGTVQNDVRSYSFDVRIVVSGEHLDRAEMHQNVNSSTSVWDFNGNPLIPAQVLASFAGSDPNWIESNGQWLQDTGWGWQPLDIVPDTDNGCATGSDRQTLALGDAGAQYWPVVFLSRYYQFQVRKTLTEAMLNTTEWGFKWSNWNCAWTAASGAPVGLCASATIAPAGLFSDIQTIHGLA